MREAIRRKDKEKKSIVSKIIKDKRYDRIQEEIVKR